MDGPAVLVGRVMLSAAVVCRHDFVQEDLVLAVDSPHFVVGEGHVLPPVVRAAEVTVVGAGVDGVDGDGRRGLVEVVLLVVVLAAVVLVVAVGAAVPLLLPLQLHHRLQQQGHVRGVVAVAVAVAVRLGVVALVVPGAVLLAALEGQVPVVVQRQGRRAQGAAGQDGGQAQGARRGRDQGGHIGDVTLTITVTAVVAAVTVTAVRLGGQVGVLAVHVHEGAALDQPVHLGLGVVVVTAVTVVAVRVTGGTLLPLVRAVRAGVYALHGLCLGLGGTRTTCLACAGARSASPPPVLVPRRLLRSPLTFRRPGSRGRSVLGATGEQPRPGAGGGGPENRTQASGATDHFTHFRPF